MHAGAESATVNLSTRIEDAASMRITGQMLANGSGAAVMLADQGNAVPGLVVGYKAQLPGGIFYTGLARFACSST